MMEVKELHNKYILKYGDFDPRYDLYKQLQIPVRLPYLDFFDKYVRLDNDITSGVTGALQLRPYQQAIFNDIERYNPSQVSIMGSPRTGKSTIWKLALVYKIYYEYCIGIIVYPSDAECESTNRDYFIPLLRGVDKIAEALDRPRAYRLDSLHLNDLNTIIYYQGSQSQIVNKTANCWVADECDMWGSLGDVGESKFINNLTALKIRTQTHKADRIGFCVSTPSTEGGLINQEWRKSSKAVYHLACLNCGSLHKSTQLAFPVKGEGDSIAYAGLQWQKDGETVIADSIRYVCPACKHSHVFADAPAMVAKGKFIHENEGELIDRGHLGYNYSVLCCPDVFSWKEVADSQHQSTTIEGKKFHQNYILARPFRNRLDADKEENKTNILSQHKAQPYADKDVSFVLFGADTQGNADGTKYYCYAVRAFKTNGNNILIKSGIAPNITELEKAINETYAGRKVLLAMVDSGGFAYDDLQALAGKTRNMMLYKGSSQNQTKYKYENFEISLNVKKLVIANAPYYQSNLLSLIYLHTDKNNCYWELPELLEPDYVNQILSMQVNNKRQNGEDFANWEAAGRKDFFDAEKIILVALDIVAKLLSHKTNFANCITPKFIIDRKIQDIKKLQMKK